MDLLLKLDIVDIVICAIMTTFIASAIATTFSGLFSKELYIKVMVAIVAVLVTFAYDFTNFDKWMQKFVQFLFVWSFSTLFYTVLGKFTINKIFNWVKNKISKSTDG